MRRMAIPAPQCVSYAAAAAVIGLIALHIASAPPAPATKPEPVKTASQGPAPGGVDCVVMPDAVRVCETPLAGARSNEHGGRGI